MWVVPKLARCSCSFFQAFESRSFTVPPGSTAEATAGGADEVRERLQAAGVCELFTEASLVAQAFFARQGFSVQQAQAVTRGAVILLRMLMRKTLEL